MTPWTRAHQALLSSTASWSLVKFILVALMTLSNHLILCCPLLPSLHTFPTSASFPGSLLFSWDGQSIGASVSGSRIYAYQLLYLAAVFLRLKTLKFEQKYFEPVAVAKEGSAKAKRNWQLEPQWNSKSVLEIILVGTWEGIKLISLDFIYSPVAQMRNG